MMCVVVGCMCFFFFFQAEDGIRDLTVTGVQTCALPISSGGRGRSPSGATIRAATILTAVTLDGRPDEPFWASADSIDDFRQREPPAGSPATERTVVKVAHDANALYIVVRCYDSNMHGVRASQPRRDADLSREYNV